MEHFLGLCKVVHNGEVTILTRFQFVQYISWTDGPCPTGSLQIGYTYVFCLLNIKYHSIVEISGIMFTLLLVGRNCVQMTAYSKLN